MRASSLMTRVGGNYAAKTMHNLLKSSMHLQHHAGCGALQLLYVTSTAERASSLSFRSSRSGLPRSQLESGSASVQAAWRRLRKMPAWLTP